MQVLDGDADRSAEYAEMSQRDSFWKVWNCTK